MAILNFPDRGVKITEFSKIQDFLRERGIWHERWEASAKLRPDATQDEVLAAYEKDLKPFMTKGGYKTADVINVHSGTPNIPALREKFLSEHFHTEDEIRFFVEGEGLFWFNQGGEVFSVLCTAGDLLSVPKNTPHWFDLGANPHVKAIRVFIDPAGWVANYTNSGVDKKYNPTYAN